MHLGIIGWLLKKRKEKKLKTIDSRIKNVVKTKYPELLQYYYDGRYPTDIIGKDTVIVWEKGTPKKDRDFLLKKLNAIA